MSQSGIPSHDPRIPAQGIPRHPQDSQLPPPPRTREPDCCTYIWVELDLLLKTLSITSPRRLSSKRMWPVSLHRPHSDSSNSTDVDECSSGAPCGLHGHCTNTEGSYRCSCATGYRAPSGRPGPCSGEQDCDQLERLGVGPGFLSKTRWGSGNWTKRAMGGT